MLTLLRKFAAEAVGTFVVVFAGTGAIVIDDVTHGSITHVGVALTFGLVVMAMIYAYGETSGAHLNPAVTLGFWTAGRFQSRCVLPYIVAQLAGAFAASLLLHAMFPEHPTLGATLPLGTASRSFIFELILSATLMAVILSVASGSKEKGIMAGVAIGGTIAMEAMFAGPICGASMNPARSLAPAIVSGNVQSLWVYIAGPIIGTVTVSLVNRFSPARSE